MSAAPYSKLLVVVRTGHGDCAALARGAALALRSGARLLLRAFDDPAEALPAETATAWLDTTMARLASDGVKVSGELIARQPVQEAMLADIEALQPDLVIKESRQESVLRRLFLTPEDRFLAHRSPSPLLVVGEASAGLPTRIVVAVDLSALDDGDSADLNHRVVDVAGRLADNTGAELHFAHVFQPVVDIGEDASMPTMGTSSLMAVELQEIHEKRFARIAETFEVPEARRHLVIGRTDLALEELCGRIGAQTVVAGSHDRSGLERFLSGSTSEGLLAHAKQDVLIVKQIPFD